MIKKKKQLEIALEGLPSHPNPDPDLEQYNTPADIAADLVWNVYRLGDVEGLKVLDLGCGTGILSIAAAMMGAEEVKGIDIDDDALDIARHEADMRKLKKIDFLSLNVLNLKEKADTILMNPPFGSQKAHRKEADRKFLEKALQTAPVVYSFHLLKTEEFLEHLVKSMGGHISHRFYYSFPIPKIYHFHRDEKREVQVMVIRVTKKL